MFQQCLNRTFGGEWFTSVCCAIKARVFPAGSALGPSAVLLFEVALK